MASNNVQIEHKKGEVNELKTSLRNPAIDRDPEKKREIVKRVIAYMTLGIDVSKLFSEMIMVRSGALSTRRGSIWTSGAVGGAGGTASASRMAEDVSPALCRRLPPGIPLRAPPEAASLCAQATSTKDHVIKKMVYLYICNYAETNPDLSLLAINTLQKVGCARHGRVGAKSRPCRTAALLGAEY
jgi:hypothetical protein